MSCLHCSVSQTITRIFKFHACSVREFLNNRVDVEAVSFSGVFGIITVNPKVYFNQLKLTRVGSYSNRITLITTITNNVTDNIETSACYYRKGWRS